MKGERDSPTYYRGRERKKIGKLPVITENSLNDTEEGLTQTRTRRPLRQKWRLAAVYGFSNCFA